LKITHIRELFESYKRNETDSTMETRFAPGAEPVSSTFLLVLERPTLNLLLRELEDARELWVECL